MSEALTPFENLDPVDAVADRSAFFGGYSQGAVTAVGDAVAVVPQVQGAATAIGGAVDLTVNAAAAAVAVPVVAAVDHHGNWFTTGNSVATWIIIILGIIGIVLIAMAKGVSGGRKAGAIVLLILLVILLLVFINYRELPLAA